MVALRGGHTGSHPTNYAPPPLPQQAGHAPQPRMPHPQAVPPVTHKHHNTSHQPPNLNCVLPSHNFRLVSQAHSIRYPRAATPQQRADCYHQMGAGGYMSGGPAPAPPMSQAVMRPPDLRASAAQSPTQQPMTGPNELKQPPMTHNFVPQQPSQPRPQLYATASYRPTTTPRPTHRTPTHHQQLYQGGGATGAPMMYPFMYPQHGVMPQQYGAPQRPSCYPTHMTPLMNYCITPTPFQQNQPPQQTYFYQPTAQPLLSTSLASPATGRSNNSLPQPPAPQPPPGAPSPIQHPIAPQGHIHHNIPAPRTMSVHQPAGPPTRKKRSFAITIKHPQTGEDVCADLFSDHTQTLSGESSERQTPQPEPNSVAEEFNRRVIETLNDGNAKEYPATYKYDQQPTVTSSTVISHIVNNQPAVSTPGNEQQESLQTETKSSEAIETPIVSAISDSPVIVPKLPASKLTKPADIPSPKKEAKPKKEEEPENSMEKHMSAPSFVPAEMAQAARATQILPSEVIESQSSFIDAMVPLPQRDNREVKKQDSPPLKAQDVDEAPVIVNGPELQNDDIVPEQTINEAPKPEPIPIEEPTPQEIIENEIETKVEPEATPTEPPVVSKDSATNTVPTSVESTGNTVPEDMELELTTIQAKLHQSLTGCIKTKENDPTIEADDNTPVAIETETEIIPIVEEKSDCNKPQVTNDINKNQTSEIIEHINKSDEKTADKQSNNIVRDNELGQNNTDTPTETEHEEDSNDAKTSADDETDSKTETETPQIVKAVVPEKPILKYHYRKNQWSPINPTGKKVYDREFLLQLQYDPLSLIKPENMNMLPAVMKSKSPDGLLPLSSLSRQTSEAFMPLFAKSLNPVKGSSRERDRDPKKSSMINVKSASLKGPVGSSSMLGAVPSMGTNKNVFHVSIQLRGDVKLNESENAWKPTRKSKNGKANNPDDKTQEIYRQFRGILNKVTPDNFITLLEKVRNLDISTQDRLEGVIDLIFEKAIEEPAFSVTYANMCNKLSKLKVPVTNAPEQSISFHTLILSKCQSHFETNKGQEKALELEKKIAECDDQTKKKELVLLLEDENRRIRMRSVGNVRFIGELYKLGMLLSTIMLGCLSTLIEKLEEEKLECLCKLLTTIGELLEQKAKPELDKIFANMQEIVDKKSHMISSRVRFMIQDVISLRKRRWTHKNVIDSQPKTIDQIQKEADLQQKHIELMNSASMGRDYRGSREEGSRNKRGGDNRRGGTNNLDNWQHNQRTKYTVDTSKLKAATNSNKNLSNIKLGPPQHAWNHGSGAKQALTLPAVSQTLTNNMYSALENVTTDPSILRGSKDTSNYHSKGVSLDRSAFNSRSEYSNNSKPSSAQQPHSNSSSRSGSEHLESAPLAPSSSSPVAELTAAEQRLLHSTLDLHLINPNNEEFAHQLKEKFKSHLHSKVVYELYCYALDKNSKWYRNIANSLHYAVQNNVISRTSCIIGFRELLELAPDLLIDYPKIYEYLAIFITPFLISKHISMHTLTDASEKIISESQGPFFLKSILDEISSLKSADDAKNFWSKSGCYLSDWMTAEQAKKFRENKQLCEIVGAETEARIRAPSSAEVHSALLALMNLDRGCECIRTYIKDFVEHSTKEDWFIRVLMQAVCEHALFGRAGEGSKVAPRLNVDRMSKYVHLINEYGDKDRRYISCLDGVTQLLHRLEHPKGVTLEIFQYLSDHYIIEREGFLAFQKSDQELEGKGVMMKALVSFYTNIMEVDNEDSCSED